uniref:Uncharacterized protein n=1 Tax=Ascaris lumbricoides TaxID=6252 RepID=A0A0M3IIM9_ASCLU
MLKIVEARCLLRARICLLNAQVQLKHNNETSAVMLVDSEIFGEQYWCFGLRLENLVPEEVIDYAEETRVKEVQPPLPTEEQKTSTQQQRQQQQQQEQLMQSIQQSSKFDHSASNRDVKSQTASSTSSVKQPSKSLIDTPLLSVKKVSDGGRDKSAKMLQVIRSNAKTANAGATHSLSNVSAASNTPEKEKPHMRVFRTEIEDEVRSSQKTNTAPVKKKLRELCGSNRQHTTEDLQGRSSFKTVRGEVGLTEHIAPGSAANAAKCEKNPPTKHQLHGQDIRSHKDYSIWKVRHKQTAPVQLTGNLGEEKPYKYQEGHVEEHKSFAPNSSSERRTKQGRNFFKDPKGKSQLTPESTRWNFYDKGGS